MSWNIIVTGASSKKIITTVMKYKILCLHGSSSTGALLKKELEIWPSNVLKKMDFVVVDAPFPSYTEPDSKFMWYDQV